MKPGGLHEGRKNHALLTLDDAENRGFSGPVWPDKAYLLARMDGQAGTVENHLGPELFSNAL